MLHGRPKLVTNHIWTTTDFKPWHDDSDEAINSLLLHATNEGANARRCLSQARRIQQIISRLRRKAANYLPRNGSIAPPLTNDQRHSLQVTHQLLNYHAVAHIRKHADASDTREAELLQFLLEHDCNDTLHIATLTRYAN